MGRGWSESRAVTKQAWGVIKENPYMLAFPVVSAVLAVLAGVRGLDVALHPVGNVHQRELASEALAVPERVRAAVAEERACDRVAAAAARERLPLEGPLRLLPAARLEDDPPPLATPPAVAEDKPELGHEALVVLYPAARLLSAPRALRLPVVLALDDGRHGRAPPRVRA